MNHRSLVKKVFNNFIKILPASYLEEMFYQVGKLLGVRSFVCEKELGLFEGSIKDNMHRYFFSHGSWAPGLQYLIRTLFANGPGTFVDVGANIGLTTIPIAKDNSKIDLYAFEPESNNYLFLRKNIIANGIELKIKTLNLALFSEDCTLDMELSENNMGDHRVRKQSISIPRSDYFNEESRSTVKIQARRLDGVFKAQDLVKPIILKVDTQGAEVQVFSGAINFLSEVDYLIVEYWPYGLQRMGDTTDSFFKIIKQFPWASIYDDNIPSVPKLLPISEFLAYLDSCQDKTGTDHLDILLSRHQIPE